MKLVIQIPCYNEAETLAISLDALPKSIPGIDTLEILIIDDGSTDNTVAVATEWGVDHVVRLPRNQGLAKAFMAGIDGCLNAGADIIVNTDADNQYNADDIAALVQPILDGQAEIVIGARPISSISHFSPLKKLLQKFGSYVVRLASRTTIPDAPSGFRAFTAQAAMQFNVFSTYTYTLETIIQAGQKNMAVTSVPVRTNADLRPSRLVKSIRSYVQRSIITIIRIFMTYRPLTFFFIPGFILFSAGMVLGVRFLIFYFTGSGGGHIQSLILASLLIGSGFIFFLFGLLSDLISVNRKLLEKIDYRVHLLEQSLRGGQSSQTAQAKKAGRPSTGRSKAGRKAKPRSRARSGTKG